MKKLICIVVMFTVIVLSQSPVITQTAQFAVGPVVALDMKSWGDDFIVSRCSYDNSPTFQAFNQLILVNKLGEIVWTKDFAPRSLGSRNNIVITTSNLFCILTLGDSLYKINRNGNIVKIVPHVIPNYMEITSQLNGEIIVMEANTSSSVSRFFIYNEDLELVKTIVGQSGATYNVVPLVGLFFVSGTKYGGGIHTNASSYIAKHDTAGNLLGIIQFPDIISLRLVTNNGRLFICGVNIAAPYSKMIYGEISLAGDTLWTKTWGASYPSSYTTVVGCKQMVPSPDGGFVVFGSVTAPGQNIGEYEPNLQSGLIFGYSPQLTQPWIKTTNDLGGLLAGNWRDSNLAVFGNLGYISTLSQVIIYSVSGLTAIEDDSLSPREFSLAQNYPNPFNPTTKIKFSLDQTGFTSLKVYDLLGREVAVLVSEELPAGEYETSLDASSLASGMYIYTLSVGKHAVSRKMALLR